MQNPEHTSHERWLGRLKACEEDKARPQTLRHARSTARDVAAAGEEIAARPARGLGLRGGAAAAPVGIWGECGWGKARALGFFGEMGAERERVGR